MISIRTKLFLIAALGSLVTWLIIKTLIVEVNVLEFLAIEFIVGFSHYIYNDVKLRHQE
jgi:hypothetical protein